ncbi:MAG: hypothetical protein WA885_03105 [Phormidesmis sp.]
MAKTQKHKTFRRQAQKPLLAAALAAAGVFNMVSAVVAEGTDAGTAITNRATATYDDGTGGATINAVSNTVTINVAEVAGITVVSSGSNDVNNGSVVTNDVVTFDFKVTNTGNAASYVFVPGKNGITPTNAEILRIDIVDPGVPTTQAEAPNAATAASTAPAASFNAVPAAGASTETFTNMPSGGGLIAADGSFTVRVTVKVTANTVGDRVGVQFGNTSNNPPNTPNQQNIRDDSDGAIDPIDDVRTIDADGAPGGTPPVNGEREAAAFFDVGYATATTNLAQATLFKTSTVTDATPATPSDPSDNKIAYSLALKVDNQTYPGVTAGSLEGTDITLNTTPNTKRILVSDVIPENTEFDPSVTPTAPTGWTVVYSETVGGNALDAAWSTTQPGVASNITRIGFVYDAVARGAIAPSVTNITGFGFTVVTNGLTTPATTTTFSIANIAQVFGETQGDVNNNIVYDESGDQRPNNLDDGVNPANNTTTFDPGNDLGIANVNDPETTRNANDGSGPDGESNVVKIVATVTPTSASELFNGPNNAPTAVGPTDNNDDFTNATAGVSDTEAGVEGSNIDPAPVVIVNQVQNPSTISQIDTVTLLPLSDADAKTAADLLSTATPKAGGDYTTDTDLPDGTKVTITFGGQSTEYTYSGGIYTPGGPRVIVGTLLPGEIKDYTVTIDLPGGANGAKQLKGYGVQIVAFVDDDSNGVYDPVDETISNITIDRVYTGFMKLFKEARVRGPREDGSTYDSGYSSATDNPTFDMRPGDFIDYRITYTNISEGETTGAGGNVLLTANNFTIVEDGSATPNTWGAETTHQTPTNASRGTVTYTTPGGVVTTEPANDSIVSIYTNAVNQVAPAETGTLEFVRKVK